MDGALAEVDAAGLLAAMTTEVRERRLREVQELRLLAQWAAIHSTDPTQGPDGRHARRIGDVLVQVGGEGTPQVQDFCLGEIAMARGTGVMSTRNALADVLDLRHRLPRTWTVCESGDAEVWVARRVAKLSRHLSLGCVGVVDAAVARILATEAAGRVLTVAEAKVIEADPALHQARVEAEEQRRYVAFSRTDEAGLRTVIARVLAGEAVYVQATLERVVEIVRPQHLDLTVDEVRSIAFGYLARPAELLQLLLEHTVSDDPGDECGDRGAAEDEELDQEKPHEQEPKHVSRALALPADLLTALRGADFTAWAPRCIFYLHLSDQTLAGARGVARAEDLGPLVLAQLADLLGGAEVTVKPVIDLSDRVRATAYEHPESLKERSHLVTGGDYWPFATATGRTVDFDHPTPYRDPGQGGPPGQTGSHNSGPLGRRHHRWKTHAGYRARQAGQGRYAWLTPHGLGFLVDHRGTRRIDPEHARLIVEAPPGVDIYPADFELDLRLR